MANYTEVVNEHSYITNSNSSIHDNQSEIEKYYVYLALNRTYDCHQVILDDISKQSLNNKLNSSVFFNFIKLTLIYPDLNVSDIPPDIIAVIDSMFGCQTVRQLKYIVENKIFEDISIKCKLTVLLNAKFGNSVKNSIEKIIISDKIKLIFKYNKTELNTSTSGQKSITRLKVSICSLRLFKYPINDCGQPDRPLHSIVSSNDKYIQFGCIEGYELIPFKSSGYNMYCDINSEWSEDFPICTKTIYCNLIDNLTEISPQISYINGDFVVVNGRNTTSDKTIAKLSCENITIDGMPTQLSPSVTPLRTCIRGKWTEPHFQCVTINSGFVYKNAIFIAIACLVLIVIIILLLIAFWYKTKNIRKLLKQRSKELNESAKSKDTQEFWDIIETDPHYYDSIGQNSADNDLNIYEVGNENDSDFNLKTELNDKTDDSKIEYLELTDIF